MRKERKYDSKFTRAAEILEQKLKQKKDYQVARGSERETRFVNPFMETLIREPDYDIALKLEESLLREFEGKPLRNIIPGKVLSNEYGESYCIAAECLTQFKRPDYIKSRQALISDLKLVYGIGPVYERDLKERGYDTIEDLMKHPKWKEPAMTLSL